MSRYDAISQALGSAGGPTVDMAFTQLDRLVGGLPASARRHRAWWANEASGTHSHARSWLSVGWRVDQVDLNAGRVRFYRSGTA
jgi:hypothetical protein